MDDPGICFAPEISDEIAATSWRDLYRWVGVDPDSGEEVATMVLPLDDFAPAEV